jgi:hypothetical protein
LARSARVVGPATHAESTGPDPAGAKKPISTLVGLRGQITTITFSPHGRTLSTGGFENAVTLWDVTHPAGPSKIVRGVQLG